MYDPTIRSPNFDALRAELHHDELLRQAAANRLAQIAASTGPAAHHAGPGFARRIRLALAAIGRPAQPDCPEHV